MWADALARTSISTQVGSLTDIDADPIIDNGRVYALGQGGRMAAYELVTGQRIWELNLAGISTPAIAGEWIFTLTNDARLLAIARATGKVRWLTQLPRWRDEEDKKGPIFWSGPVLAGGNLWAVNSEGEVYRISSGEGSASLFTDLDQPVSLAPVVANNTLYILDDSGRMYLVGKDRPCRHRDRGGEQTHQCGIAPAQRIERDRPVEGFGKGGKGARPITVSRW